MSMPRDERMRASVQSKRFYIILALGLCAYLGLPARSAARAGGDGVYQYHDHFSCSGKRARLKREKGEGRAKTRWSALSGMKAGPGSFYNWRKSNGRVLRPFASDGCSMSPDGVPGSDREWVQCCVHHDVDYWLGGTEAEKEAADNELQRCIARKGYPEIGRLYRAFVKRFGGANSSQIFRWGYGWNYKRPYSPLSESEESMVSEEHGRSSDRLKRDLKDNFAHLTRVCDTYDYGLQGLSRDEEEIYRILGERLESDDVIEWAKPGDYNLEKREYLVKLHSCPKTIIFIFFARNEKPPEVVFGPGARDCRVSSRRCDVAAGS